MMSKRKPTHPGEVLWEDVLAPLALTITEAAKRLRTSRKTLSAILNGRAPVTPDMAVKIALATGTTPESWLLYAVKTRPLACWAKENKSWRTARRSWRIGCLAGSEHARRCYALQIRRVFINARHVLVPVELLSQ